MHLASKGKKAAIQLCRELSLRNYFKIFYVKIQPILLYASEIWGYRLEHIKMVHLFVCKRFLGVPTKTPNKMVYGDLGRYPLYVNSFVACIRYQFQLLQMERTRLPRKAYTMLLELDQSGKNCWVSKEKFCVLPVLMLSGYSRVLEM